MKVFRLSCADYPELCGGCEQDGVEEVLERQMVIDRPLLNQVSVQAKECPRLLMN